ncbi:unnamed protein product, partial [Ectocarpus sp. 12 AP-2014]
LRGGRADSRQGGGGSGLGGGYPARDEHTECSRRGRPDGLPVPASGQPEVDHGDAAQRAPEERGVRG